MNNRLFTVEYSENNGGLKSLVLNDDQAQMNWIEGLGTWGVPLDFEYTGMEAIQDGIVAHYRRDTLVLDVERRLTEDSLKEVYTFHNTSFFDLYFQRGEIGIYATFNDSYQDAATCVSKRCNAHIYCGGEVSYVHAMKMGPYPDDVALVLTNGSLDSYSVRRIAREISNDRGDFLLHPQPMHLLPGQKAVLSWELVKLPHGELKNLLVKRFGLYYAEFRQETVFLGEPFRMSFELPSEDCGITVRHEGEELPVNVQGLMATAEFYPRKTGEYRFEVCVNGKHSRITGCCVPPLKELIEKRLRFIIRKQQMKDTTSHLHGAFLTYDNEEQCQYFSFRWRDQNASRERLNMGFLLCRYLQKHEDQEADEALKLFEQYVLREIYDAETGEVFDGICRHREFKRPYNTAQMINLWLEMYYLRKDDKYLYWIARSIKYFYEHGGYRFYPNGTMFADAIYTIRHAGHKETADELEAMLRKHVETICEIGVYYPAHEVRFEQTIITPAVAILSAFCNYIEKSEKVLEHLAVHVDLLERLGGSQPDYHLNSLAIRHWDDYWFGKRKLYGDTFPHYLSAVSARAFRLYAEASGKVEYHEMARKILRNNLCLFNEDGSASCAYVFPYSVTMLNEDGSICQEQRRGEFFDPLANDQDGALYLLLCDDEDYVVSSD